MFVSVHILYTSGRKSLGVIVLLDISSDHSLIFRIIFSRGRDSLKKRKISIWKILRLCNCSGECVNEVCSPRERRCSFIVLPKWYKIRTCVRLSTETMFVHEGLLPSHGTLRHLCKALCDAIFCNVGCAHFSLYIYS